MPEVQNRWVRQPAATSTGGSGFHPTLPSLEVVYRTDPAILAAVLPPPLAPPPEPRVHVRVTEIDLRFGEVRHQERVGYIAVDAAYEGEVGEYPLLMPIDLEPAVAISREKFGEPKKLAELEFGREGDHVQASITRQGVTFVEMHGDVVEPLPTPDPYPSVQWWFKFLPAAVGTGFDYGPVLLRVDQVRSPRSLERVEGKLVLRDLASCPVVDLPVQDVESMVWTVRTATHQPSVVGPVDADAFEPFAHSRYDGVR
jgi:acetoacetate decarboxylase